MGCVVRAAPRLVSNGASRLLKNPITALAGYPREAWVALLAATYLADTTRSSLPRRLVLGFFSSLLGGPSAGRTGRRCETERPDSPDGEGCQADPDSLSLTHRLSLETLRPAVRT